MKKYKIVIPDVIPEYKTIYVKGWNNAEAKVKELFAKYIDNTPDLRIYVMERNERIAYADYVYTYKRDVYGDDYFWMSVMGDFMPLYDRLLEDDEREELERRRHEVDRHITELNAEELKELLTQVSFGSMYLRDYQNSFDIDEEEVYDYCEYALDECDQHGYTNTPDVFAKIILEGI